MKQQITVEVRVDSSLEKIWTCWTGPEHIKEWNNASSDWHTTAAENDLRIGGTFKYRMESKDGTQGFDFGGIYTALIPYERIEYEITGGRKVKVEFTRDGDKIKITEMFDPEDENPIEMQKDGWQAILDNFRKYVERGIGN